MKLACGLVNCEKILLVTVGLCLLVLVAVSAKLFNEQQTGAVNYERIRVSEEKIKAYELDIKGLQVVVAKLQRENCELQELKDRVYVETIIKVDSISLLPFSGKSDFFTEQSARLDTIRSGYASWN